MIVAGEQSDFDSDPFADTSHPVSPIDDDLYSQPSPLDSHTTDSLIAKAEVASSSTDTTVIADDSFAPLRNATIQCCRCPNVQPLFTSWDDRSRQHSAACDACTSSFCAKCEIQPSTMSVVQFDAKSKAAIPPEATDVQACWFCPSCGTMEAVPLGNVKRMRGVGEVNVKGLSCGPCRQKAGSSCLKVAWWTEAGYRSTGSRPLPLIQEQEACDGVDEGELTEGVLVDAGDKDAYMSIRQRMSLKATRTRTVNRMRRWTSLTSFKGFG
jgi:hypothetical protein